MQVSGIKFENVNAQASLVASTAQKINTTLKNSTDTITEGIEVSTKLAQKMKELNEDYKKTLVAVEDLKKMSNLFNRKAEFFVNKDINRVVVRIFDSNTNELIKELPSSEIQYIQKRIRDLIDNIFYAPKQMDVIKTYKETRAES